MPEMQIKNAQTVDLSRFAPPTAVAVTVTISVWPPSGVALVYSPKATDRIPFNGPRATQQVPIDGSMIYVQLVRGATEFDISCDGYTDDI
jgi:hypothetical protein